MDDFILNIFITEIEHQAKFALLAFDQVETTITNITKPEQYPVFGLNAIVFRNLHSFLTHSANISKLLWPVGSNENKSLELPDDNPEKVRVLRAINLRNILQLSKSHYQLQNRKLRNHLEHYDERLDDWAKSSKNHNIVIDFIGSYDSVIGIEQTDRMRWYDPRTRMFYFRGEKFDLENIHSEVIELMKKVELAQNRKNENPKMNTHQRRHSR